MLQLILRLRSRFSRDEGQAMVEYALILALISIIAIAALAAIGTSVNQIYETIRDALATVPGIGGGGGDE
jgi:pilus assembly protein Flp/PilA